MLSEFLLAEFSGKRQILRLGQLVFWRRLKRMDQLTRTVRKSNWINIIQQFQNRPAGTTAKQWLVENGISEKSYCYWFRKTHREVCEQEGLPEATSLSEISFVEIPVKTALDMAPVPTFPAAMTPVAVIRSGGLTLELFFANTNYLKKGGADVFMDLT